MQGLLPFDLQSWITVAERQNNSPYFDQFQKQGFSCFYLRNTPALQTSSFKRFLEKARPQQAKTAVHPASSKPLLHEGNSLFTFRVSAT